MAGQNFAKTNLSLSLSVCVCVRLCVREDVVSSVWSVSLWAPSMQSPVMYTSPSLLLPPRWANVVQYTQVHLGRERCWEGKMMTQILYLCLSVLSRHVRKRIKVQWVSSWAHLVNEQAEIVFEAFIISTRPTGYVRVWGDRLSGLLLTLLHLPSPRRACVAAIRFVRPVRLLHASRFIVYTALSCQQEAAKEWGGGGG